jgi:hypothetical protein
MFRVAPLLMVTCLDFGLTAEPPLVQPLAPPPGPTTTAPATQPVQATTTQPVPHPAADARTERHVAELVAQLGDGDYRRREAAKHDLAALGPAIVPKLINHLPHPDEETSDRLIALIGTPQVLSARIEFAMRLLQTTDPDRIEQAVYLLFDDPPATCAPFKARARGATGALAAICGPIIEQLETRRAADATFREHYERLKVKDPAKADSLMELNLGSNIYAAEAAYWSAVEALEEHSAATTRPARLPPPPAPRIKLPTEPPRRGSPSKPPGESPPE